MQGSFNKYGDVTLTWNIQGEKLYSPDGLSHCLPCETCGHPQWVSLLTVSVLCDRCALALDEPCCDGEVFHASNCPKIR